MNPPKRSGAPLKTPGSRLVYLDLLRCLAILLVITLHTTMPILNNAGYYGTRVWYLCMLQNEWSRVGVPLFLMLSGYLLLRDSRTLDVTSFYKIRLPRILIPLAVWNLIYCLGHARREGVASALKTYWDTLLVNGSKYHFWYIYTLLGLYLLAPFLKRIVDHTTTKEQIILLTLILFPGALRPLFNMSLPLYLYLFDPLIEGYAGFFLLGWMLGSYELPQKIRAAFYLGGAAGYALGTIGNLLAATPEGNSMPFNIGYYLNHYLCAAAVFVLVKTLLNGKICPPFHLSQIISRLSGVTFGVYWVHVLVLDTISPVLAGLPAGPTLLLLLTIAATAAISFAIALILSRIPGLRRLFT